MGKDSPLNPDTSMWDWVTDDLRFYLKKSGMSGEALARKLKREPSSVYNLLDGRRRLQVKDAEILDELWDLNHHFRRQLAYAKLGGNKEWFGEYVEHEATASVIKTYEALAIPGLLQLPEYAAELAASGGSLDVAGKVRRRMARQRIFDKPKPPTLWVLITENVIDWTIGGPGVMKAQLAHLLEMADRPNIGVRVVPRSAGAHAGIDGSFSLIYGEVNVAYTESPGGGRLVRSATEALEYGVTYDRIGQSALPERSSLELIRKAMEVL
jgi:hypothetical protein